MAHFACSGGINAINLIFYNMAYMELVPKFKCSYTESPDVVFSCVEQDFCGRGDEINYWIDWDNRMSLYNWSENIGLICRPGW